MSIVQIGSCIMVSANGVREGSLAYNINNMARKIEAATRTWLPWIIQAYQDNEELTTFIVCKTVSRLLISLEPREQLEEIIRVLDNLVAQGYFTRIDNSKMEEEYWYEFFDSYQYAPTDTTNELIKGFGEAMRGVNLEQTRAGDVYNFHGDVSNTNINSPSAIASLEIINTQSLDDETRQLLEDLKNALARRDNSKVKQILGYIADKGVDVVLQLALGGFFTGR